MTNNDILRRFRYAMNIKDIELVKAFKLSGHEVSIDEMKAFLVKEEDGQVPLNDRLMELLLDGYVELKRGKPDKEFPKLGTINNNLILKKLQISLSIRSDEMLEIFKKAGAPISKSELSAVFRKPGHKNYKECGDRYIRKFLQGLTMIYR